MASLETERLRLRPWRVEDASFHRRLWAERDPRVPAHRRLTPDGRPTVADLEEWLRRHEPLPSPGLLVVERRGAGEAIGYCGLVENSVGRPEEPELAYEFLKRSWHHGYATEAAGAVIAEARRIGYESLAATVRNWNTASLRVLDKLGFLDTGEREEDAVHGASLVLRTELVIPGTSPGRRSVRSR